MKKILLSASAAALLLGSCSKDEAELAPAAKGGETTFIASMTIGNDNETRNYYDTEIKQYIWDDGDMVGVSTKDSQENIPFITVKGGQTATFKAVENDLDYLGREETYYMVYPYDKSTSFDTENDGFKVAMSIPTTQRYRQNTFATMTAPAVGIAENFDNGQMVKFYPVASYIRVKVNGSGTIKSLKMEIKDESDAKAKITGAGFVDLTKDPTKEKFELDLTTEDGAVDHAIIDFGKGGLELSYTDSKELFFIVSANTVLTDKSIVLTATLEGEENPEEATPFKVSATRILGANSYQPIDSKSFTFGLQGKTIIADAVDLLRYVYAINNKDAAEAKDFLNEDGTFKTALVIDEINCNDLDDMYVSQVPTDMQNVYNWYLNRNKVGVTPENKSLGSFEFPSDVAYSIEGGLTKASTIRNMRVTTNGDGIFNNSDATVKNIVLDNASVYVKSEKLTEDAYAMFLANEKPAKFENLTIKVGTIEALEGTDFGDAALMGSVAASNLGENEKLVDGCPRHGEKEILVAKSLNIDADVDLTNYVADAPKFGEIVGTTAGSKITIVGNVDKINVERSIMDVINATKTASNYFSVMMENGQNITSLWTGFVGQYSNGKQITTAEDLAAAVAESGKSDVKFSLMSNIDLRNLDWVAGGDHKTTIDGNGRKLLNVKITNYTVNKNDEKVIRTDWVKSIHYVSVFGKNADITALDVDGLTIDIIGEELENPEELADIYVGGLAYEGVATYVNLTKAAIDVAADVNLAKETDGKSYIGAVMSISQSSSLNATVNASATINGTTTEDAFAKISK